MLALAVSSPTVPSFSAGYEFEIIIGFILILGIFRGLGGRRYSAARVIRTPAIYIVITVFAIFFSTLSNTYAQAMILLLPVGIPLGFRFGRDVKFFQKNGVLYYRRSPIILLIWAVALIARVSLEFSSLKSLIIAIFAINALLSLITGVLLGEAIHILRTHKAGTGAYGIPVEDFNTK